MQRPTTSVSRSARRAQMPTTAPRSARASASPAPMPDEPPVTSVRHPFRSKAIFHPTFDSADRAHLRHSRRPAAIDILLTHLSAALTSGSQLHGHHGAHG